MVQMSLSPLPLHTIVHNSKLNNIAFSGWSYLGGLFELLGLVGNM